MLDNIIIELFGPEHPGERLPLDGAMFGAQATGSKRTVKFVRFGPAPLKNLIKLREGLCHGFLDPLQPQANAARLARAELQPEMSRRLGSDLFRVNHTRVTPNDGLVEGILHKWSLIRHPEEQLQVGIVFREKELLRSFREQPVFPELMVARLDHPEGVGMVAPDSQIWPAIIVSPAPGVAKPDRR